jgi:hypothetical protein
MSDILDETEAEVIAILREHPELGFSYTADDGNQPFYDAARRLVDKGLARIVRERGPQMVTRRPKFSSPLLQDLVITRRVRILGFIKIELV